MVVVRNVSICVEDIFCFMAVYWEMPASAVVRALGLGYSPSLSASCLSTWAGDTTPDIVFKSSHRKLVKRQYDFVFFLLPLVSFCSYIHVYDLALCSYDIMRSIWLLYKYPHVFLLYNKYWGYYYKTQHWSCNCFVTKLYWHDLKGVAVVKKRGTTDQNKLLTLYWQSLNFPLQGQTVCWHGLQFWGLTWPCFTVRWSGSPLFKNE